MRIDTTAGAAATTFNISPSAISQALRRAIRSRGRDVHRPCSISAGERERHSGAQDEHEEGKHEVREACSRSSQRVSATQMCRSSCPGC